MDKDSVSPPSPKPWKCPSGHVLGQVVRHNGIRRLELFRQAIPCDQHDRVTVILVGVVAQINGSADNVKCSICGMSQNWHVGQDGLDELLERRGYSQAHP